jgi:hypothetical protein
VDGHFLVGKVERNSDISRDKKPQSHATMVLWKKNGLIGFLVECNSRGKKIKGYILGGAGLKIETGHSHLKKGSQMPRQTQLACSLH